MSKTKTTIRNKRISGAHINFVQKITLSYKLAECQEFSLLFCT